MALSAPTFNNFPAKWPAVTGSGIYLRWKSVSGAAKYQSSAKATGWNMGGVSGLG